MTESEIPHENLQVTDVTETFLSNSASSFKEYLDQSDSASLKISLDLSDVVANKDRMNAIKHFLLEGKANQPRMVVIKAASEEQQHFESMFPPGVSWEIITR